jgi:branched-subunit amino acid transport protein
VTWAAIIAAGVGTYAMKAAGPVVLGTRAFPPRMQRALILLAVALLAALIATATLASGRHVQVDARLAGVAAAGVAIWLRAPFVVVILVAAVVAGGLRAI